MPAVPRHRRAGRGRPGQQRRRPRRPCSFSIPTWRPRTTRRASSPPRPTASTPRTRTTTSPRTTGCTAPMRRSGAPGSAVPSRSSPGRSARSGSCRRASSATGTTWPSPASTIRTCTTMRSRSIVLMNARCFSATDIFLAGLKGMRNVTAARARPAAAAAPTRRTSSLGTTPFKLRIGSMASFQADGTLFDGNGVRPDVRGRAGPGVLHRRPRQRPRGSAEADQDAIGQRLRRVARRPALFRARPAAGRRRAAAFFRVAEAAFLMSPDAMSASASLSNPKIAE